MAVGEMSLPYPLLLAKVAGFLRRLHLRGAHSAQFKTAPRAHSDPMESDRRSSFLFGRIFCDEPVSTSSENALAFLFVAFSATNRCPLRRKMLYHMPHSDNSNAPSPPSQRLAAIGLMLVALIFFSMLDTAAKYLATQAHVPVTQITWIRFLVQFMGLLILVPAFGLLSIERLFTTKKFTKQLLRSALLSATTLFNFIALQYLRLDQTVTVIFLAPLLVAALAGPLLGEWVGWRRGVAIAVGFLGVLIAVRPGFGVVQPAIIYAFLAMAAYAFFMLLTRHLVSYDPPLVTLFYSMFVGTLAGAPFAIMDWVWPEQWTTWALLLSLGILGGTGHFLFILAYMRAPASSISPFLYAQLITMIAAGYLVFGDVPDAWTLAGAGVIIASGVYLIHRERLMKGME